MIARLERWFTIALLLAAGTWAAWALAQDRPGLAAGGALVLLLGYAVVLAIEFALMVAVNRADPAPRADGLQVLRAWWGEVLTAPRVFCWLQPFRSRRFDNHLPTEALGQRGVLLVHGFMCNRGLWNPWLQRLCKAGVPCVAVDLEPPFGAIDAYAPLIERAVQQLEAATSVPTVIVAHSMGGLAVRAWMDRYRADARVERVVTIGSPHHGTWVGRAGLADNARQMAQGSAWLAELSRREPRSRFARFTCYYSHCDNIVFPASSATLPGADNRHVSAVAHVDLVYHERVNREVLEALCGAAASVGGCGSADAAAQ
jgi:pimeloyl-ACP methyl ester carboxylesterase